MATHLRTELVLDALNMAVWQRRPEAMIHHSDQGTQYTSIAFGLRYARPSFRNVPSTAATCPWGRARRISKASSAI